MVGAMLLLAMAASLEVSARALSEEVDYDEEGPDDAGDTGLVTEHPLIQLPDKVQEIMKKDPCYFWKEYCPDEDSQSTPSDRLTDYDPWYD